MLVVQGSFPSAGFAMEPDLPVHCEIQFIQLAPFSPPVMMFVLQVGPTVAHWFADMSDETMWDLLANWDSHGTMAVAAKLDDGRVLFGVAEYKSKQELVRCAKADMVGAREHVAELFPRMIAIVHAVDGIKNIATSILPDYPEAKTAYMCTVRTSRTPQVVFPVSGLPFVQRYLTGGLEAFAPELDILKRAGFAVPTGS